MLIIGLDTGSRLSGTGGRRKVAWLVMVYTEYMLT